MIHGFAKDIYLELRRNDYPKSLYIGREYYFIIVGRELRLPLDKKAILHWESDIPGMGLPEAIIKFTSCKFGTLNQNTKATRVGFKLEEIIS